MQWQNSVLVAILLRVALIPAATPDMSQSCSAGLLEASYCSTSLLKQSLSQTLWSEEVSSTSIAKSVA
jgi:hypothetical protein